MKIDRLIGIITTLQQKKIVTAPYLAEKFEVSRRTINRDIDDICKERINMLVKQIAEKENAAELLLEAKKATGLPIVTEIVLVLIGMIYF